MFKSLTLFQTKILSLVVQTAEKPGISAQDLLTKKSVESYITANTESNLFFLT